MMYLRKCGEYFYAILYVKKMAMVFRMVMLYGNNIH